MKLGYNHDGVLLSKGGYADWIIQDANMVSCKPTKTLLPFSHSMNERRVPTTHSEKFEMQDKPFRNIPGKLMYLAHRARPDLAVAISLIANFQYDPASQHCKTLKMWSGI